MDLLEVPGIFPQIASRLDGEEVAEDKRVVLEYRRQERETWNRREFMIGRPPRVDLALKRLGEKDRVFESQTHDRFDPFFASESGKNSLKGTTRPVAEIDLDGSRTSSPTRARYNNDRRRRYNTNNNGDPEHYDLFSGINPEV